MAREKQKPKRNKTLNTSKLCKIMDDAGTRTGRYKQGEHKKFETGNQTFFSRLRNDVLEKTFNIRWDKELVLKQTLIFMMSAGTASTVQEDCFFPQDGP